MDSPWATAHAGHICMCACLGCDSLAWIMLVQSQYRPVSVWSQSCGLPEGIIPSGLALGDCVPDVNMNAWTTGGMLSVLTVHGPLHTGQFRIYMLARAEDSLARARACPESVWTCECARAVACSECDTLWLGHSWLRPWCGP